MQEETAIFMKNGYIAYFMPGHISADAAGLVYAHRLVAEEKLGRHLKEGEVVHHIDGNKHNNSPDNIIVFDSKSSHTRYHRTGEITSINGNVATSKEEGPIPVCPLCGIPITKGAKLCIACRRAVRAEVKTPPLNQDELADLVRHTSVSQIANDYGVAFKTVKKWLAYYGIPNPVRERAKERYRHLEDSPLEKQRKKMVWDSLFGDNKIIIQNDVAIGETDSGKIFYFDAEHYSKITKKHWTCANHGNICCINEDGGKTSMQVFLYGDGKYEHINGNKADNRKENLRKTGSSTLTKECITETDKKVKAD